MFSSEQKSFSLETAKKDYAREYQLLEKLAQKHIATTPLGNSKLAWGAVSLATKFELLFDVLENSLDNSKTEYTPKKFLSILTELRQTLHDESLSDDIIKIKEEFPEGDIRNGVSKSLKALDSIYARSKEELTQRINHAVDKHTQTLSPKPK